MKIKKTAVILSVLLSLTMATGCGAGDGTASLATGSTSAESASSAADSTPADSSASGSTSTDSTASGSASTQSTAVTLSVEIDSTDGKMRITVPSNWEDMKGKIDTTGSADQNFPLQAGCAEEESFLIANGESKSSTSLASLQEYSDMLLKGVTANTAFSDVRREPTQDLTLTGSGLAAKKTKFTAVYSSQTIAYWVYAVEGASQYYQFCCWTADDNTAYAEPVFDAMINSFQEIQ